VKIGSAVGAATQMQVDFQSARPPTGISAAAKKWDFGTSRLAALFSAPWEHTGWPMLVEAGSGGASPTPGWPDGVVYVSFQGDAEIREEAALAGNDANDPKRR
jgi:hypothetical protein